MTKADHDILTELATDIKYIRGFVENNTREIKCHEDRLSKVENFNSSLSGKLAIIGIVVMLAINMAVDYIKEKLFK